MIYEDRERRMLVDHRPGGEPIVLDIASWFAIEIAQVKRTRIEAALSTYESMIEHSRTSSPARLAAAVFAATTHRGVLVLYGVGGHEEFRETAGAWDDLHWAANGDAVTESRSLGLYRVSQTLGDMSIDPASSDTYIVERNARQRPSCLLEIPDVSAAFGFRGLVVFRSDDNNRMVVIYRFEHANQFEAARAPFAPHTKEMLPVKTFSQQHEVA